MRNACAACSRLLLAAGLTPTYEAVRAEVRGERAPEGVPYLNITRARSQPSTIGSWVRAPRRCAYERRNDRTR